MDRHLNLFQFFNQSNASEYLEKNISRGLVLCLQNDTLLLHQFLRKIISQNDYDYLLANKTRGSKVEIDIENGASQLQASNMRSVYGIMLTEEKIDKTNFFNLSYNQHKDYQPITDIVISIGEILIMIEVKRTNQDCKQQLFNQLYVAFENNINSKITVIKSIAWSEVMATVSTVNTFNAFTTSPTVFTDNFINLIRQHKLHWLPVEPFSHLSDKKIDEDKRYRRLETCVLSSGDTLDLLKKNDRIGFKFKQRWADEILPRFEYEKDQLFLKIYIWPANTKSQGHPVFYNKNWDWLNITKVSLPSGDFEVKIMNEIKFSHIQGNYLGSLNFNNKEELKEINTTNNFDDYSGMVKKKDWDKIEDFLDSHLKPGFDWRTLSNYDKFTNSGRTFYNLSLGFQVCITVPYSFLSSIDINSNDTGPIIKLFKECNDFFEGLLD